MRVVLVLAVLAALIASVAAAPIMDDFEAELAAHAPELVERAPNSFSTLADLGAEGNPELSFAQLASQTVQQHENEAEAESDDAALLETGSADPAPWHRNPASQPVLRNGDGDIKCLDGDCTRATQVRKVKVGDHPTPDSKPPSKLDIALGAVKEEIMVRAKELHLEKEWSKKVAQLIDEYQQKLTKVTNNIANLRAQTKALLRKKKQIQNVQVQNKLRYKLQLAQSDLNRLQKQMEHIAGKENEFADTEKQLKSTMNALKASLLKLRGQDPSRLAKEGIN